MTLTVDVAFKFVDIVLKLGESTRETNVVLSKNVKVTLRV